MIIESEFRKKYKNTKFDYLANSCNHCGELVWFSDMVSEFIDGNSVHFHQKCYDNFYKLKPAKKI